jgi:hypothetical protein
VGGEALVDSGLKIDNSFIVEKESADDRSRQGMRKNQQARRNNQAGSKDILPESKSYIPF